MQPGRVLDSKLWELLTGHKTITWITCVFIDGEWRVKPNTLPCQWSAYAAHGPVFVENCMCGLDFDDPEEPKYEGHVKNCFEVVPHLSTTYEGMGIILEVMFDNGWMASLTVCKSVVDGKLVPKYLVDFEAIYCDTKYKADHKTVPGATAMAAYNALSGTAEGEK